MTTDDLSEREQQALEHLQQARALGVSLREYAEARGLEVKDLYNRKAQLVRKGVLPGGRAESSSEFIPVEVARSTVDERDGFRLVHVSGWTIECTSLPEASWVASLVRAMSEA